MLQQNPNQCNGILETMLGWMRQQALEWMMIRPVFSSSRDFWRRTYELGNRKYDLGTELRSKRKATRPRCDKLGGGWLLNPKIVT